MRVTFPRLADRQKAYSVIERDDGVVYSMASFTTMGPELPHDIRHLIVERELRIRDGIWGTIAAGTVYKSMQHMTGRQSPQWAERSARLKKAQRERIMCAELLANLVEKIATLENPSAEEIRRLTRRTLSAVPLVEPGTDPIDVVGSPPPEALAAAASALQVEAARWARLRVGEQLVYEWPPARQPRPPVRALRPVPKPRDGNAACQQPHRHRGRPY